MQIIVRPETEKDFADITAVNDLAFGRKNEGLLVENLRKTAAFIPGLSLAAICDGKVVGHILFYPVKISDGEKMYSSLALAPMSVLPEYQKKGIGSRLVTAGLERARAFGHRSVIVLGHPEYYPKFGFVPASLFDIKSPFDVPDDVFMAMELTDGGLDGVCGIVQYPAEFNDV